jgi:Spy/CpxP family protein refolding chaperone
MKLSARTVLTSTFAVALALAAGSPAFAQTMQSDAAAHDHPRNAHRPGLLRSALGLSSLTSEQRTSIDQLIDDAHAARIAARRAQAQVLSILAQQVETAKIDPTALGPALATEKGAAAAGVAVERDGLTRLHAILTPAQRSELVDALTAREGARSKRPRAWIAQGLNLTPEQKAQFRANLLAANSSRGDPGANQWRRRESTLETFRGDAFDPTGLVVLRSPGERAEEFAAALVPVLTDQQRSVLAGDLRQRAARESAQEG